MKNGSFEENLYGSAKAELKRDIKTCVVFIVVFSIMFEIVLAVSMVKSVADIGDAFLALIPALFAGITIGCLPVNIILAFRFAWQHFSSISILFLGIILAVAVSFGPWLTIIKFIMGYSNIKKFKRSLSQS